MKVIAGLGNPGRKYINTRHNVGFRVVDTLAARAGIEVNRENFSAMTGDGRLGGEKVLLLKPLTYMNRSGRSVLEAVRFYKCSAEDLLVVIDDLALPVGRMRLRASGSAGGHNGLSDIISRVSSDEFARLRIGIGSVGGARMVGHVLGAFDEDEEPVIGRMVDRAAQAVEYWVAQGVEAAMNRYNGLSDISE
jgi:PTH1 family peptidyl-tRNA hydrolase